MRFRLSIRGLLALVGFLAFAFAALRGSSLGWATASILLAIVALATATLACATWQGPGRASWIGFAIFGWIYFLIHFGPIAQWKKGHGPEHFTTWTLDGILLPLIAPGLEEGVPTAGEEEFVILRSGKSGSFFDAVAHASMTILLGLLGALLGPILTTRGEAGASSPST